MATEGHSGTKFNVTNTQKLEPRVDATGNVTADVAVAVAVGVYVHVDVVVAADAADVAVRAATVVDRAVHVAVYHAVDQLFEPAKYMYKPAYKEKEC